MSEDCDDLLDGEDEEEVLNRMKKPVDDHLFDFDDDEEKDNQRQLDLELGTDIANGDFDLNIDHELDLDSDSERNASPVDRERKEAGTLLETPPGLNLFQKVDEKYGFKYFSSGDLSLELDFQYARRGKLKGHGYTDSQIDDILKHRTTFIRHLLPEGQSVLLHEKADFKAIMDYLFYSISVCTEKRLSELLIKSFFDLCKNYSFTWRLELKHLSTVLCNYGIHHHVLDDRQCSRHLQEHLRVLKKQNSKVRSSFRFSYASFLTDRKSRKPPTTGLTEADFKFCVSKFIFFLSELCMGLPSRVNLKSRSDWTELCVFCYLLCLLGTEKLFIEDFKVSEAVSSTFLYLFDSVSTEHWYCGAGKVERNADNKIWFGEISFPGTLASLVHDFPAEEYTLEICSWRLDNHIDPTEKSYIKNEADHRLNIIHKLELVPHSYRGNQLKRFLAFYYLQSSLIINHISSVKYPTVKDIASNSSIYDSTYLKILWHSEQLNFAALLVIVKLIDVVVGTEPQEAFPAEDIEDIQFVQKKMLERMQRKLPSVQTTLKTGKILLLSQLKSHVENVIERWKRGCGAD